MTHANWRIPVVLIEAVVLGACGAVAYAQENPATTQKTPDIVMEAYRMRMDGKIDEAKQALEHDLAKKPQNAAAWFELARLEFQSFGKTYELDSAQKAIEQAVAAAPDNARYHRSAADIAVLNGILKAHGENRAEMLVQFKKATKAAQKAVTLDPDDHQARMILVSLYGNNPPDLGGDPIRAEQQVAILETRSPVDGARARCEFSLKNEPEKKLALWNEVANKFGDNPRVHENLAREYAWTGNVEQATAHADKALALDPSCQKILVDLARAFALSKKLEPAEQFARRYLALDPPGPVSLRAWTQMALGRIQQMAGDDEASAKSLQQARELDPYCWFTMTPPPGELFETP